MSRNSPRPSPRAGAGASPRTPRRASATPPVGRTPSPRSPLGWYADPGAPPAESLSSGSRFPSPASQSRSGSSLPGSNPGSRRSSLSRAPQQARPTGRAVTPSMPSNLAGNPFARPQGVRMPGPSNNVRDDDEEYYGSTPPRRATASRIPSPANAAPLTRQRAHISLSPSPQARDSPGPPNAAGRTFAFNPPYLPLPPAPGPADLQDRYNSLYTGVPLHPHTAPRTGGADTRAVESRSDVDIERQRDAVRSRKRELMRQTRANQTPEERQRENDRHQENERRRRRGG